MALHELTESTGSNTIAATTILAVLLNLDAKKSTLLLSETWIRGT